VLILFHGIFESNICKPHHPVAPEILRPRPTKADINRKFVFWVIRLRMIPKSTKSPAVKKTCLIIVIFEDDSELVENPASSHAVNPPTTFIISASSPEAISFSIAFSPRFPDLQ
jgi:hypothetical protein